MPNKFERQVQQKMEELNFSPSPPVWQHIESQIRNKKKRRGAVIWFALLFLLMGGSLWFWNASNGKLAGTKISSQPAGIDNSQNSISTTAIKPNSKEMPDISDKVLEKRPSADGDQLDKEPSATIKNNVSVITNKISRTGAVKKNSGIETRVSVAHLDVINQFRDIKVPGKNVNAIAAVKEEDNVSIRKQSINQRTTQHAFEEKTASNTLANLMSLLPLDQSLAQQQNAQKTSKINRDNRYKWKVGVIVEGGLSGTANNLNVFQKNVTAPPVMFSAIPYTNVSNTPPATKVGISLGLGVTFQKQFARRLYLNTGFQYNYLSTIDMVGGKLKQGTIVNNTALSNQYYTATVTPNRVNGGSFLVTPDIEQTAYHNHFHFVEIPLSVSYSVSKKAPLSIHGGLSIEQLIYTNALVFDNNTRILYNDKNAFNHTQYLGTLGFDYGFHSKNLLIETGPYINYGLKPLSKNDNSHLFFVGLSARFFFDKKH